MTQWPAPVGLADHSPTLLEAFDLVFAGQGSISPDAFTSATVLDTWKTQVKLGKPVEDILAQPHRQADIFHRAHLPGIVNLPHHHADRIGTGVNRGYFQHERISPAGCYCQ